MLAAERAAVRVDDETLRARVRAALGAVNGMSLTGVRIEVSSGAVSVAGVVQTGEIARRAGEAVGRIGGVRSLDNRLMSGEMLHFD